MIKELFIGIALVLATPLYAETQAKNLNDITGIDLLTERIIQHLDIRHIGLLRSTNRHNSQIALTLVPVIQELANAHPDTGWICRTTAQKILDEGLEAVHDNAMIGRSLTKLYQRLILYERSHGIAAPSYFPHGELKELASLLQAQEEHSTQIGLFQWWCIPHIGLKNLLTSPTPFNPLDAYLVDLLIQLLGGYNKFITHPQEYAQEYEHMHTTLHYAGGLTTIKDMLKNTAGLAPLLLPLLPSFLVAHALHHKTIEATLASPGAQQAYVAQGRIDTIRVLLDHNADVHHDGTIGTPLLRAIHTHQPEIVRLLLAYKSDVNRLDEEETRTPLMFAAQKNQITIANILIEHGAQIKACNEDWHDALHYARTPEMNALLQDALVAQGPIKHRVYRATRLLTVNNIRIIFLGLKIGFFVYRYILPHLTPYMFPDDAGREL